MKILILTAVIFVLLWFGFGQLNVSDRFVSAFGLQDPKSEFVEVVDRNGRDLFCKLTAKHDNFVRIQRKVDKQEFIIPLGTLSEKSRERFDSVSDFNQKEIDAELLKRALREIQPELLYIPALCTFRCQYTGRRMKSTQGMLVDAYRDYLRSNGFHYREVSLQAEKSSGGGYYMPSGIKETPCIRVGDILVYKRDRRQIHNAMLKHYMTMYGGES